MLGCPRWLSGKESACPCRRHGFDPGVRKIPWRRKWQPTPVFLPGKPMDRGAQQATVHGVAESQTWPSNDQNNKSHVDMSIMRLQLLLFSDHIRAFVNNHNRYWKWLLLIKRHVLQINGSAWNVIQATPPRSRCENQASPAASGPPARVEVGSVVWAACEAGWIPQLQCYNCSPHVLPFKALHLGPGRPGAGGSPAVPSVAVCPSGDAHLSL